MKYIMYNQKGVACFHSDSRYDLEAQRDLLPPSKRNWFTIKLNPYWRNM